jgi:hypothetical protein
VPRLSRLLQGFRSLLTDSQDASYLFNAVLDAVVDHTLPLVQVGTVHGTRTLLYSVPQLAAAWIFAWLCWLFGHARLECLAGGFAWVVLRPKLGRRHGALAVQNKQWTVP